MDNKQIARILRETAQLLEIDGAIIGRYRSYEKAAELRDATLSGNKRLLDQLILKVRDTEGAGSADALQELADKYEYDTLTRLLEEACRR